MTTLQDSEERFRALFEHAPLGLLLVDQSGEILFANIEAGKMFGYDQQEFAGQSIDMLIPPRFSPLHNSHVSMFYKMLEPRRMGEGRCLSGLRKGMIEFPLEISLIPIMLSTGQAVACWIIDITKRMELERSLRHAERLASQGTLMAGVTHDLRNPLFAIAGSAQLLIEKLRECHIENRTGLTADAQGILDASQEAISLIECWLDEARTASNIHQADCQIQPLVDRALLLYAAQRDTSKIALRIDLEQDLPAIRAHPHDLIHVFVNLFLNSHDAIQQTPQSGVVTFTARKRSLATGDAVEIHVIDDGPGIPAGNIPRIFDPFFTTKPTSKGIGLGLWMAYRIVNELSGTITCQSIEGHGTSFILCFPVSTIPENKTGSEG